MATAWHGQLKSEVAKVGARKAKWLAFWRLDERTLRKRTFGVGPDARRAAELFASEMKAKLKGGKLADEIKRLPWDDAVKDYTDIHLATISPAGRKSALGSLGNVKRLVKPSHVDQLTTDMAARFASKRLKQRGKKPGSMAAPSAVNKDLRTLRAFHTWLVNTRRLPRDHECDVRFVAELDSVPRYITPEHFELLYKHADAATLPQPSTVECSPADWWKAWMVFCQMSGWRLHETLSLTVGKVDLNTGTVSVLASRTKGKSEILIALHPVVTAHLRKIIPPKAKPSDAVFDWDGEVTSFYDTFGAIQDAAGIRLDCKIDRKHECTESCHRYQPHDFRRAFATMNFERLPPEELQKIMRHKDPSTTKRYINTAQRQLPTLPDLHVPSVLTDGAK